MIVLALLFFVHLEKSAFAADDTSRFDVQSYIIKYNPAVFTNVPDVQLSSYTGTNVDLGRIVQAAAEVLLQYQKQGYPKVNISIAQEKITNGIVTMNVYQGAVSQVFVSGKSWFRAGETLVTPAIAEAAPKATTATNATATTRTNTGPRFNVRAYEITGDTLLTTNTLMSIFAKYVGTNVSLQDILQAASDLQAEYRDRGYPTVNVTIPPQQITNAMVKLRVFQGRLADIVVTGNHYYSSNNIMRALPSLHTNIILVGPVFQAELDRANANQNRQIYPVIEPGPIVGTSLLHLEVKDRIPLHAKAELNNQSSPGTPDLRVNSSVSYDNLWQLEHSFGLQYSFSPEKYKSGDEWSWYDKPLVANGSGFYRMPLGDPEPIEREVANSAGQFGYSEATRKFSLPPPSGQPELNVYASRSTVDTGVQTLLDENITSGLNRTDVQQDLTINNDLGTRLTLPFNLSSSFQSAFSGGLDYKTYSLTSSKTNYFTITQLVTNTTIQPPQVSTVVSVVPNILPTTSTPLQYLPLSLQYNSSWRQPWGVISSGLGASGNAWHSGSARSVQDISGSPQSTGYWFTLSPNLTADITIRTNWTLTLHGDGQWADQPLISNEQYGAGGVASVRGYHEGEVFGDTGWRSSIELKTPPHLVGLVYQKEPLTVRGSIYMDYAEVYLIDPQGRNGRTPLWSTGVGAVASVGTYWQARFLVSMPLLDAGTTEKYQPTFNFALSLQF